jgi:GNAT superfamily N-acetyltransferase
MPQLTDKDHIRTLLRRDPRWAVYALGDLTPRMFEKCRWFTPDLTLVLQDYGTSILFAMGAGSVQDALAHVTWPVHLQVQEDARNAVARVAAIERQWAMWRMAWEPCGLPDPDPRVTRLGPDALEAVRRLYADGASTGESPDFFFPSMLADGVFQGIYEDGDLVAAACTHLVARDEDAAAIGNIYTRRDRRGRGLGRAVTAAVVRDLDGIGTIGLNVRDGNAAAIHLYESLGFVRHCAFFEALAVRA